MLRDARRASQRRLGRAVNAQMAIERHERTFHSHRRTIKRQGEYIEQLNLVAEIAADAVNPHLDDETRGRMLVDLERALEALDEYRRGVNPEER